MKQLKEDISRLKEDLETLNDSDSDNSSDGFGEIKRSVKSRKEQHKFHRAMSESEEDMEFMESEDEKEIEKTPVACKKTVENKPTGTKHTMEKIEEDKKRQAKDEFEKEKNRFLRSGDHREKEKTKNDRSKNDSSRHNDRSKNDNSKNDPFDKFKKLGQQPPKYNSTRNSTHDSRSRSSSGSDSSDDFPVPSTPKNREKEKSEKYSRLFDDVRQLQKKVYELDLKHKKDKYKK